ncbi:MAG: calcium/sodium antiporter [Candidatus Latescibacteria bacterium]|nr:calcium/sodium antiporter [Candidatus Latescibacterota bacterium]
MEWSELLLFISGLILLAIGAEIFVRGSSNIATLLGISPLVVGLTVVAFGTSAPEVAVGLKAGLSGQAGVTVGNAVGSNIINVLLVLGMSATIAPLVIARKLIRLDVPIMIGVSVMVLVCGYDGVLSPVEGLFFVLGIIAYVTYSIYESRTDRNDVDQDFEVEYVSASMPVRATWIRNVLLILTGLFMLVLGADWLVESAVSMARSIGVSELTIGLTVVAIGTSLPEIATSVIATLRGERDIVVGNIVGSNIFNVLLVLGSVSLVAPGGLPIPMAALNFDIPIMIAVAIACLPIFVSGSTISRNEGILFLAYFAFYLTYLVMDSQNHDNLPLFSAVMLVFVIPISVISFFIVIWRWRKGHWDDSREQ